MVSRIALFVVLYGFVLSPCRGDDAQEALTRKVKVALAIEAAKPSPVTAKTLTAAPKKTTPIKIAAEPVKAAPAGSLTCTDGAVIAPDPTRPGVWVFVSGPTVAPVPASPIRSLYQLSAPCPDGRCPVPAKK